MLIIGISGGIGAGKTSLIKFLIETLPSETITVISQDSYYKDNRHLSLKERLEINFDHPDSLDFELLIENVRKLKEGNAIIEPIYSFQTCSRSKRTMEIYPRDLLIVEGLLIFNNDILREMFDMKVFMEVDDDERLRRILERDILERGRTVNQVLSRYEKTIRPMHRLYVEPTRQYADFIIQGNNNYDTFAFLLRKFVKRKQKKNQDVDYNMN